MQEIYLTLWRNKDELINSEYGMITQYAWCLKEMKRIPDTLLETRVNPTNRKVIQVCLKKKVSDEYFKERLLINGNETEGEENE